MLIPADELIQPWLKFWASRFCPVPRKSYTRMEGSHFLSVFGMVMFEQNKNENAKTLIIQT